MADSAELFSTLLEMRWRGIPFPTASFRTQLTQDHAQHKWPDRDGAHIEATGRAPLHFTAKCIFRNGTAADLADFSPGTQGKFAGGNPGLFRARHDTWQLPLYPTAFRAFLEAMADRTTGDFIHPELGKIRCKPVSADVTWDANRRDGVDVDATWVESTDNPEELDKILGKPSPTAAGISASGDLDAQISDIKSKIFVSIIALKGDGSPADGSFSDAMRSVQSAFDQTTLLSRKAGGLVDRVLYRANALGDSISAARSAQMWPAQRSVELLKAAAFALKQSHLVANKDISIYVVPADQTLSSIASTLGAKIDDLIKLNRGAVGGPVIKAKTVIRYYG